MELNNLTKIKGNRRSAKRVGRGGGSGKGWHTTGRGQKGQKARTGYNIPVGFEGGQVPLYKKLPMMGGFKNHRSKRVSIVSLEVLNRFKDGDTVTAQDLVAKGILKQLPKESVKILANGNLTKKLTLKGFAVSKSAKEKLAKSGSNVIDL